MIIKFILINGLNLVYTYPFKFIGDEKNFCFKQK